MSRDAIYQALAQNSDLLAAGGGNVIVFANYSLDQRPFDQGPFIILRWQEQTYLSGGLRGATILDVWAHMPKTQSTDFTYLDSLLDIVDSTILGLEHVAGGDGYTLTSVRATGRGGDFRDDGYDTITRNAAYQVLSRKT